MNSEELEEILENPVLAGDASEHDAAGLRLDLHAAKFRGGSTLPRAGTRLLLLTTATVIESATEDANRDGVPEGLHFVVKVESFAADVIEDESPEEEIEQRAQDLIAERDRQARLLYESPRRKLTERDIGGSAHVGEHGVFNRKWGA